MDVDKGTPNWSMRRLSSSSSSSAASSAGVSTPPQPPHRAFPAAAHLAASPSPLAAQPGNPTSLRLSRSFGSFGRNSAAAKAMAQKAANAPADDSSGGTGTTTPPARSKSFWALPSRPSLHFPTRKRSPSVTTAEGAEPGPRKRAISDASRAFSGLSLSGRRSRSSINSNPSAYKPANDVQGTPSPTELTQRKTKDKDARKGLGITVKDPNKPLQSKKSTKDTSEVVLKELALPRHMIPRSPLSHSRSLAQYRAQDDDNDAEPAAPRPKPEHRSFTTPIPRTSPSPSPRQSMEDDRRESSRADISPELPKEIAQQNSSADSQTGTRSYHPKPLLLSTFSASSHVRKGGWTSGPAHRREFSNAPSPYRHIDRSSLGPEDAALVEAALSRRLGGAGGTSTFRNASSNSYKVTPGKLRKAKRRAEREKKRRDRQTELAEWSTPVPNLRLSDDVGQMVGRRRESDSDVWTWIETSSTSDDNESANRSRSSSCASFDVGEEDLAPVWRASLEVGRRVPADRLARGRNSIVTNTSSPEIEGSGVPLTSKGTKKKRIVASTHANSSGELTPRNNLFGALLQQMMNLWSFWTPYQKARALFGFGFLGGWFGNLVFTAIRARVRRDSIFGLFRP